MKGKCMKKGGAMPKNLGKPMPVGAVTRPDKKVMGYAKGGSIDGVAIRGKTKCSYPKG